MCRPYSTHLNPPPLKWSPPKHPRSTCCSFREAPAAAAAEPAPAEAAPATTETPVVAATEEPAKTEEKPDRKLIWIVLGVIVVIGAFLLMRRKKNEA